MKTNDIVPKTSLDIHYERKEVNRVRYKSVKTMAAHVKHLSETNNKFNKVKIRRSKFTKKSWEANGKTKDTRIIAAPERRCEILISGIDNVRVTPYNLQNYMESNFINVVRLVRLSGENKQRACYHLVVPISSYDKVMNHAIWEDGITVRYFTRYSKLLTVSESHTNKTQQTTVTLKKPRETNSIKS